MFGLGALGQIPLGMGSQDNAVIIESSKSLFIRGLDSLSNGQSAFIRGIDTSSPTKDAFIFGTLRETSTKNAFTYGLGIVEPSKLACIVASTFSSESVFWDTIIISNSAQETVITYGKVTFPITRTVKRTLALTNPAFPEKLTASQLCHLMGARNTSDSTNCYVVAGTQIFVLRSCYLHGAFTNISATQNAHISSSESSSTQNAYINGFYAFNQSPTKHAYIAGTGNNITSSKNNFMRGKDAVSPSKLIFLRAVELSTGVKEAYIVAPDTTIKTEETAAFIRGNLALDNLTKSAFMRGHEILTGTKNCYIGVAEPATGSEPSFVHGHTAITGAKNAYLV